MPRIWFKFSLRLNTATSYYVLELPELALRREKHKGRHYCTRDFFRQMSNRLLARQPATRLLLVRNLQPFPAPDALDTVLAHIPAGFARLDRDTTVAVPPVLAGQRDDGPGRWWVWLNPSPPNAVFRPFFVPRNRYFSEGVYLVLIGPEFSCSIFASNRLSVNCLPRVYISMVADV